MSSRAIVQIAFLDVGQGDTIVVTLPETGEAIVIDCLNGEAVFQYLESQSVKYLRGLIISHLHLDHFQGASYFLNNCQKVLHIPCESVIFNWPHVPKSRLGFLRDADGHSDGSLYPKQARVNFFEGLRSWIVNNSTVCYSLTEQIKNTTLIGPIAEAVKFLYPIHGHISTLLDLGLNNTSGIMRIQGAGTTALLTGDIEPAGWRHLASFCPDLKADVFKFSHHGAWLNADVHEILMAVQPSYVVISVGTEGIRYHHPNSAVFAELAKQDITLFCTEATNQCGATHPLIRASILNSYSKTLDHLAIHPQQGCPCAGTVIMELGETVRVLQPEIRFHQETIINGHFATAQCAIDWS